MGSVTSLFVRKVVRAARDVIDEAEMLRSVGLDPSGESNVSDMISDVAYYDLLERIADQTNGAVDLPLRVGETMHCDDYGAFGLSWKSAPTLRASLARAERYWRLLTTVSAYEVRVSGEDAYFLLHRAGERRLGMRLSNEATLASVVSIIREVSPVPFHPREVYFKHRAPADTRAHEAYFLCPVRFESDLDGLLIPASSLGQANRLGDEGITQFLLRHLDEELSKLETDLSLRDRVQETIAKSLSEGVPKIPAIARRLGMSERTLQRRLREEGLSFQKLVDAARCQLAEGLLVHSEYSLAEVAFLTGFSEQSAFSRAFRRWHEMTPAVYRETRQTA